MKKLLSIFALTITAIISLTLTAPQVEASTTYSLIFNQDYLYWGNGQLYIEPNWSGTTKSPIINNSIIINDFNLVTLIHFWENNNYIGYYGTHSSSYRISNDVQNFSIPTNATHFAINALNVSSTTHFPNTIAHSSFTNLFVTSQPPTPYTIEQKNPYYDQLLIPFGIRDYNTVFVAGTDYSQKATHWNFGNFWWDDNGYNVGSTAGDNDSYANRVAYLNLIGEHLYLDMPLPSNINEAGTYDLWFTLFDYDNNFKATYRPTSNNIAVSTLRDLGGYKFHLNYTENYVNLPGASLFKVELWRSETNNLFTFYDTDSTTLIQLHKGATNEYQPGNNTLWVDFSNNTFDVRDYLTALNISLPTKEGHTLLGFTYDYEYDVNPEPAPAFVFSTALTDTVFYPEFEQNITYDVTFTDYDDSVIEVVTVEAGETAIPTQQPTRAGYVFAYWEPPVTDIQGNLTTKAVYYVPITWRNTDFATIRIDQVIEGEMPTPPTLQGYTRTWTPTIVVATQPTQYILVSEVITTSGNEQTSGVTPIGTNNATGLTDLFTGVFGAIVGALMILGTIDLFGLQLSSLFWLFFAGTGFMLVWKLLRG